MTILPGTPASASPRVASMPSTPGIRTSIRTTSGRSVRTASIAADPSPASPTTSRSGCASRIMRKPARTKAWSSTIKTRINPHPDPPPRAGEGVLAANSHDCEGRYPPSGWGLEWQAAVDREPPRPIAPGMQLAAKQRDALAHADQSVARRRGRVTAVPGAVIADVERQHGFAVAHADVDAACAGVLEDVGGRLLQDAIGGEVECRRQRARLYPGRWP